MTNDRVTSKMIAEAHSWANDEKERRAGAEGSPPWKLTSALRDELWELVYRHTAERLGERIAADLLEDHPLMMVQTTLDVEAQLLREWRSVAVDVLVEHLPRPLPVEIDDAMEEMLAFEVERAAQAAVDSAWSKWMGGDSIQKILLYHAQVRSESMVFAFGHVPPGRDTSKH